MQPIRDEFNTAGDLDLKRYVEYLDLNRFADAAYQTQLFTLLVTKCRDSPIDLVITANAMTLTLWLDRRADILPTAPVVFFDISPSRLATLQLPANVTGVTGALDYTQSVEWALGALPDLDEVVIIHGVSPADLEEVAAIETMQEGMRGRVRFTDLSTLPLPEIKARVASLPKTSLVLYHLMLQDAAGSSFRPTDALRAL